MRPAAAGILGFGRGRGIGHGGVSFDYYLSPTGNNSTADGSLANPYAIDVLSYTPSGPNNSSYYNTRFAGKRIGLIGPYICPYSLYPGVVTNAGSANDGVILGVPSGTAAAPTYIGSSDTNGNESPGACTLDFHKNATSGQSSVTTGLQIQIAAITTGTTTVIQLSSTAGTNPFAGKVGETVWVDSSSQTDLTGIGLTPPSHGGGAAATLYTISAVSSVSPWTVSLSTTTTGTYSPANASIYWNYVPAICACLGQSKNSPFGSSGWFTINGVNVTGFTQAGIIGIPSPGIGNFNTQSQITSVSSSGGNTTFVTSNSNATQPFVVGQTATFDNIQATGSGETLTGLNYSTNPAAYPITAVGGAQGSWSFTIATATSGTLTAGTNAYTVCAMPGMTVEGCEIYDGAGWAGAETACIYCETLKGLKVTNCKLHDVNSAYVGGLSGSGIETFYAYDAVVRQITTYNVDCGVWPKSFPMGNFDIEQCVLSTNALAGAVNSQTVAAVFEGQGQTLPGFTLTVKNNILISPISMGWTDTDSQIAVGFYGQVFFSNNTCYASAATGAVTTSGVLFAGASSSGGVISTTPVAKLTAYNNVFNLYQNGSPVFGGYIWGCASGTTAAPTSINVSLDDYEMADVTSTEDYAFLNTITTGPTDSPISGGGLYTLASWQAQGFGAHITLSNPSYQGATLDYAHPADFKLVAGSAGSSTGTSPGSTTGTTSGSACDKGAWGGATPPTQIGSSI